MPKPQDTDTRDEGVPRSARPVREPHRAQERARATVMGESGADDMGIMAASPIEGTRNRPRQ
jgi:hypothetical protein